RHRSVRLVICFDLAIDQIAQFGLSSLKVIYYSAQLFSKHIATTLNYRTSVPVGSYFSVIETFQEVYHGHGTSKVRISGGERAVTGKGSATTYRVITS
ncbi:hypothetical protein, partial [Klebsiella pneumoniae]|uniref:hypothetical protein n=1 Tax=Klebsiella pneumoniae TaxID=573 RepID=UPI00236122C9